MTSNSQERREFFRIHYNTPFQYKAFQKTRNNEPLKAQSKNISQSGVLFETRSDPPKLSSILWLNLDIRTLTICKEIEKRALVLDNGVLGKVVRVEEAPDKQDSYEVGVCFLTQDQRASIER